LLKQSFLNIRIRPEIYEEKMSIFSSAKHFHGRLHINLLAGLRKKTIQLVFTKFMGRGRNCLLFAVIRITLR